MEKYLRQIPAVDRVLNEESIKKILDDYSRRLVVDAIRDVNQKLRERILDNKELPVDFEVSLNRVVELVDRKLKVWLQSNLKRVINGTGVVLHTNLGRSLLAESAQKRLVEVAENYSTLEMDIESGERGSRYEHVTDLLVYLTGAEDCLVVNNNAGAVLLALNTLAQGKEVIISRGQLVEIGGSFRIPEVMEQSGADLVEVGATNKTHLRDYEAAMTDETGLLLRAHTSNYRIVGFSKEVLLQDLVELGHDNGLPVLDDLGSGTLIDFSKYGFSSEPTVQESIETGVDVVTFSGDKLLGGPQAGIIIGKKEYIQQMKRNPLTRALRVDKFTLAALEETLRLYLDFEAAIEKIPTLRLLTLDSKVLKDRADRLAANLEELGDDLEVDVKEGYSQVGGGAFPTEALATFLVEISITNLTAERISSRLRGLNPPLFTRIQSEKVIIDPRTIKEEEISFIVSHFKVLLEEED
ncbi:MULTISPECIES: L-seryl-tRNA(Sec) selenium transferase [unclassified Candidatus Frackibacter]|uniref:L-seryl-tRNA(Sec) selenium transferase n=1 Tax=unclassified Candidatus Frackibacter TaxID=2648818 RepID=UPI00088EB14D|nr:MULTISPECIES: L-seryl-tRNA(Sec) selenium transferase [unclassified Candidatus Frackibacter]SDC45320.1 L-seryl-tRNA(Sec) selenium transferase [Candidatus Frackibacter sp. WG11]SEM65174.1 L-seryl-tRNA(Sec) selenium transferase [Candidatus Frackibacter sp. WG12]SFL67247.1 L-seryl-tRNA(Sec) selenium transferase [Candidatus Frackibacter sp. WG13]